MALVEHENALSPQGFVDQIGIEAAHGNRILATAMAGSLTALHLQAQTILQPFSATAMAPDAVLYQGRATASGRNLLIAFTGRKNRLMLPLPLFLQDIDAATWDVLVLRDRSLSQFRNGCHGLATSFPDLAHRLAALAADYTAAAAIGTSMGGLPAIRLSLLTGSIRGISVGGSPPSDAARLLAGKDPGPAFDLICACLPPARRDLLYVYGEDHAQDAEAARLCAGQTGGVLLPVPDHNRHFILWQLHQSGRLGAFLQTVLDPGIGPAAMAKTLIRHGFGRSPLPALVRRVLRRVMRRVMRSLR